MPPTARAQVILIGAICFACPGMYNAITSLAGGIDDPAASTNLKRRGEKEKGMMRQLGEARRIMGKSWDGWMVC